MIFLQISDAGPCNHFYPRDEGMTSSPLMLAKSIQKVKGHLLLQIIGFLPQANLLAHPLAACPNGRPDDVPVLLKKTFSGCSAAASSLADKCLDNQRFLRSIGLMIEHQQLIAGSYQIMS